MTISEAERIVLKVYPNAFPFNDGHGAWSICIGTRTAHGNIRIVNVGWHETIQEAWVKAAKMVEKEVV